MRRVLIALVALLSTSAFSQVENPEEEKLFLKAMNTDVRIYGKLLDQDEQPVPGASILYCKYGLDSDNPNQRRKRVKTKKDGTFEIHVGKRNTLDIRNAKKDGYEFMQKDNDCEMEFEDFFSDDFKYLPDKNNPRIFHIRKREPEGRIIIKYSSTALDVYPGEKIQYDFLRQQFITKKDKDKNLFPDFEMSGEFDDKNQEWTVVFRANGEGAGIQLSDKRLFRAPETGYSQEVICKCKSRVTQPPFKSIFMKLRAPGWYLRIDTIYSNINQEHFNLYSEAFINPYGDRNLEDLTYKISNAKSSELHNDLEQEASKALRNGIHPQMPDFKKLQKDKLLFFNCHNDPEPTDFFGRSLDEFDTVN